MEFRWVLWCAGEDPAGGLISGRCRASHLHTETIFGTRVAHHSFWCDWHAKLEAQAPADALNRLRRTGERDGS